MVGRSKRQRVTILGLVLALATSASAADDREARDHFEAKIRPVLVEHCYPCHSVEAAKSKGGLKLDSRDGLRAGGDSGPSVLPGKPAESLLLRAIEHASDVEPMPPKGKLPDSVIADVRRWIELGAIDPRDTPTRPRDSLTDRWALKPIARPDVPKFSGNTGGWVRNPIDAFILAKLRQSKLEPSPEADRRTLIRRVTFDLIGLPPSPEEVDAFLSDPAPDAYERVVDRLLASPHHGERRARQWMDLVHFAETHGHDQDRIRPNAWPYRDYLIDSINRDKPYARFVQEQIAADVLFPDDPASTVGLGMLAAGPWDESSLRDIREDSIDRQVGYYLDRDDVVTTVMSTFVSSTVHCARCHDHKFDPITTREYYGLQAVFAGIGRAERAYDPEPNTARVRRDLNTQRKALHDRDKPLMELLLGAAMQAEVASWATSLQASRISWTVLEPSAIKSSNGTTFETLPDHSILAGGVRPPQETYTFTSSTDLSRITGARLELIPDARLPSNGPGRNENGNLHLTEFEVRAAPKATPDASKSVPIARVLSDFDQAGWGIASALDRNPGTAWGIHPQVGKPHEGVFEFADNLGHDGGTTLTFVLRQTFPVNHPIGRFRLSVTDAPRPVRVGSLPEPLAGLLKVPSERWTREQRQDLAAIYLLEKLDKGLAALPAPKLVYAGASNFAPDGTHKPTAVPRPVFVLNRGDIRNPSVQAAPGALGCVEGLTSRFDLPEEGPRRAALARWITDPNNPLTWRSIVNRAWLTHFGRGLVDTPNDFGRMGSLPTHPELLDWLAWTFREDGESLKRLERLIVTSATYRQSSEHNAKASSIDADNRLLWRMNRTRLDADEIRDAVLSISGRLDLTMGGPSVQHFTLGAGVHVTPTVDYRKFDWDATGASRRAVYRFTFRTLPDPFMEQFDAADASQLTPVRNASITPLQALAMLNDPFILRQSEHFAHRLEGLGGTVEGQIRAAFALTLGRPSSSDEVVEWSDYATRHGLANFARMLLNSNEFLFVN